VPVSDRGEGARSGNLIYGTLWQGGLQCFYHFRRASLDTRYNTPGSPAGVYVSLYPLADALSDIHKAGNQDKGIL